MAPGIRQNFDTRPGQGTVLEALRSFRAGSNGFGWGNDRANLCWLGQKEVYDKASMISRSTTLNGNMREEYTLQIHR